VLVDLSRQSLQIPVVCVCVCVWRV
jgi:hypothetical protein